MLCEQDVSPSLRQACVMPVVKTKKQLADICDPKCADLGDALTELLDVSKLRTCPDRETKLYIPLSAYQPVRVSYTFMPANASLTSDISCLVFAHAHQNDPKSSRACSDRSLPILEYTLCPLPLP